MIGLLGEVREVDGLAQRDVHRWPREQPQPLRVRRSTSCGPHWATGITGQPVVNAIRAAPVLPVIGHRSGSRVSVPSG